MRKSLKKEQIPQEFAKEHWLGILSTVGTLAALSTILLIRYYKKIREEEGKVEDDPHLAALLREAEGTSDDETTMLLETGGAVVRHIKGATKLTEQLAEGLPETLPDDLDPRLKKRFKSKNPRDKMRTLGRIR